MVLSGVQQDNDERDTDVETATALLPGGLLQSFQESFVIIAPSAQPLGAVEHPVSHHQPEVCLEASNAA